MLAFKQFIEKQNLNETPQLNSFLTKDRMDSYYKLIAKKLADNHHNANLIDKDNNYYSQYSPKQKTTTYYRMENNEPREFSTVSDDNVQNMTAKGGGDVSHNINFMYHHAKNNGEISSDKTNTHGSKNLWINIIKNPRKGFSVYHRHQEEEHKITPEYLDKHKDDIWNKSSKALDHKVILRAEQGQKE